MKDFKAAAAKAREDAHSGPDDGHALVEVTCIWKGKHLIVNQSLGRSGDSGDEKWTITHAKSGKSVIARLSRYEALTFAKRFDRLPWDGDVKAFEGIARAVAKAKKEITGYEDGCAC